MEGRRPVRGGEGEALCEATMTKQTSKPWRRLRGMTGRAEYGSLDGDFLWFFLVWLTRKNTGIISSWIGSNIL